MNAPQRPPAPEWRVQQWFNADQDYTLAQLRGRVVLLHAFQMLCPGCVSHGIPQAQRVQAAFSPDQLTVIGLHSVFEHHQVMNPAALGAFIHEYRLSFPVAVDRPGQDSPIPQTMRAYAMRGTPTTVLIDRRGQVAWQRFGRPNDLELGTMIGRLLGETEEGSGRQPSVNSEYGASGCDATGCAIASAEAS